MTKSLKKLHAEANAAALAWSRTLVAADEALIAYRRAHEAVLAHKGYVDSIRAAAKAPLTETEARAHAVFTKGG
jgi:hypothetical protein